MPRHRLVRATAGRPFHQGRDVIVSISACDADCAGANPVALTISLLTDPIESVAKFYCFGIFELQETANELVCGDRRPMDQIR